MTGFFALRDLGPSPIKGSRDPVRVFVLEGMGEARTRLDLSRARGLSKFVGRDRELSAITEALDRSRAGDGQIIAISADAGTGKSRLCFELLERCHERRILVRECRGVAHGTAIPYLPILEFYREIFGILGDDDPRRARQKIAGTVVLLDPQLSDELPLLFDFFGVADPAQEPSQLDEGQTERRVFDLLLHLTRARSEREPAVLLFEDLHWFDGPSESFFRQLADAVAGTRTLLVGNYRPEYDDGWLTQPHAARMHLAPLDDDAMRALTADLLGRDPSLESLAESIRERTLGNPFFCEEVVRSLAQEGALKGVKGSYRLTRPIDSLQIPPTVQSVLAARIDRLSERDKGVLQSSSLISREFPDLLLRKIADLSDLYIDRALHGLI